MTAPLQPDFLPLQFNQILEIVRQLGISEKRNLLLFLLGRHQEDEDLTLTHLASERTLATDWLTATEDEAWQNL